MFGFIKRMKRGRPGTNVVILLLCAILVFSTFPSILTADVKVNSTMRHTPPAFFVSEHRIQLDARVIDPSGVELVRCYFKAAGEADYVFVSMVNTGGNDYSGILPAPSPATEEIEYLFLMVNAENKIVKSQTFVIQSQEGEEAPSWQDIPQEGDIQVSMELDQLPAEVPGFSDSIVMDQVESGLRFGVVAGGLYLITATKTAGTSGAAASATSAGTVMAGSGGLSTAAMVGIVAAGTAATAATIGVAASATSSSSSKSGNSDTSQPQAPHTWNSWHAPSSPKEGETVTVFVQVNSPGVRVNYSVSGTDGYNTNGTKTSDSNGRISFMIPGATSGVVDRVTVLVPAWGSQYTKTWTYTFRP